MEKSQEAIRSGDLRFLEAVGELEGPEEKRQSIEGELLDESALKRRPELGPLVKLGRRWAVSLERYGHHRLLSHKGGEALRRKPRPLTTLWLSRWQRSLELAEGRRREQRKRKQSMEAEEKRELKKQGEEDEKYWM